MNKKTVLIFGISSFIGSNLAEFLKDDFRVVGTYFESEINHKEIFTIKCDITNGALVSGIINLTRPDIVIYCVGEKSLKVCHENLQRSDSLNANGVFNVLSALDAFSAKFFYFSSAFVYSGGDKEHLEENTPISNNVYGGSVASAEFYIEKSYLNYVILRLPIVYGKESNKKNSNLLEDLQSKIIKKDKIEVSDNVLFGFINVLDLVDIVKNCISKNITNEKVNICSSDLMTEYEFAQNVIDLYNYKNVDLIKQSISFPINNSIPNLKLRDEKLCFSLSSKKAIELSLFEVKSIKSGLIDYRNSFNEQVRKKNKGLKLV